ncbi:ABC transporter permease [Spirulina sp. CS-785/01]|uniref:ABC transporter permease n=1 Tax=Spirulina sp. CS-785/01 TaxID=3021716 RepID=UPI00232AD318|nr:ABC transporter permease [Spirulina sp. CS-785/01]MDB9314067.1 ABC transporter permease [Spirulina sp. CS-785/01]
MRPWDLFNLAFISLRGNKLRTLLTTLSVFMGVMAVNATLQVRRISETKIENRLAQREAPHLGVWMPNAQMSDLEYLQQELPQIRAVGAKSMSWRDDNIFYQQQQTGVRFAAVSLGYFETTGRQMVEGRGRSLIPEDFEQYRNSIVIDELIQQQLFGQQNPVEEVVYVGASPYRVVGVMEAKIPERLGEDEDPTGEVVIPLSTYQATRGRARINRLLLRPHRLRQINDIEPKIETLLRKKHPEWSELPYGDNWPYVSNNVDDILEDQAMLEQASRGLFAVGAIALIIAGVGIANITVAAVIERTPEIGLRRAIGAKQRDILLQFLLEAIIISWIGGITAIIVVDSITYILSQQDLLTLPPYELDHGNIAFSLTSAVFIGLSSSLIPATRASKIEPVSALKSN